jgi:CubicO group peptidase (beta-lactamase class C family)
MLTIDMPKRAETKAKQTRVAVDRESEAMQRLQWSMIWRNSMLRNFALLTSLLIFSAFAVHTGSLGSDLPATLDSYFQPYVKINDFSGVVLVANGDRAVVREYGMADRKHSRANLRSTAFRIASLSKTFTAASISMLIERGTLHLDDSLARFFPQFPNGNQITVEQLLTHKSGLVS